MTGLIHINRAMQRREQLIMLAFTALFLLGAFIRFPHTGYRGVILTAFNFFHFPAFFILYIMLARSLNYAKVFRGLGPLLCTLALVLVLELGQPLWYRSASLWDVLVSSAGAFYAFWLHRLIGLWRKAQNRRAIMAQTGVFGLSLLLCCFHLLKPFYSATSLLIVKHRAFPALSAHHPPLSELTWFPLPQGKSHTAKLALGNCPERLIANSADPVTDELQCITVVPAENAWSGLAQILGVDSWQDYQRLQLEILTPTAFTLLLRIDDVASSPNYEDHFNREIALNPGLNQVSIPLESLQKLPKRAPLDLTNIRKLYLFISPTDQPPTFYLRQVFLEK